MLVAAEGFYSPKKKPKDIREVRDEERLIILLVWRHDDEDGSWELLWNPKYISGMLYFRLVYSSGTHLFIFELEYEFEMPGLKRGGWFARIFH